MKLTPWLVVLMGLTLASCSGSKSAKKVSEETPQVELSEADEFIDNTEGPGDATAAAEAPADSAEAAPEATAEATTEATAEAEPVEEAVTEADEVMPGPATEEPVAVADNVKPMASTATPGTMMSYTVQKNETLMLIAFKLFGDYEKWKWLANWNKDKLKGSNRLSAGMVLSYESPAQEFVWNPQGLPYLIRTGDTLGRISKNVYQTPKKWKLLWENNKPLIKDPNRIFAGFTLYYLENGREVASGI